MFLISLHPDYCRGCCDATQSASDRNWSPSVLVAGMIESTRQVCRRPPPPASLIP